MEKIHFAKSRFCKVGLLCDGEDSTSSGVNLPQNGNDTESDNERGTEKVCDKVLYIWGYSNPTLRRKTSMASVHRRKMKTANSDFYVFF